MQQAEPQEFKIITSENGVWREEKVSLAQEKAYSPWQWKRMYKEKMSPEYSESMEELRRVDEKIKRFVDELNYLYQMLPSDPTRLPDIALILIEINQRLDSITEAGSQVKPPAKKKFTDFYGKFHIDIPENLRTAAEKDKGKIARAGLIGDFVNWLGKKINEYTDPEIREMKRSVQYLLNYTKQNIDSINKTLGDMTEARKTGDVDKYIESTKFIAKEQADFRKEFDKVYEAYLREPYEHAKALEQQAKEEAEAQGEVFEPKHEQVSINEQGQIEVIEVEDAPDTELKPMDFAEDAEEALAPDTKVQPMDFSEDEPPTGPGDAMEAHKRDEAAQKEMDDEELAHLQKRMPPPLPIPQFEGDPDAPAKSPGYPVVTPPERSIERTRRSPEMVPPTVFQGPTDGSPNTAPLTEHMPTAPESAINRQTLPYPPAAKKRETIPYSPMKFDEIGGEAPSSDPAASPTQWDPKTTMQSTYAEIENAITKVAHDRFLKRLGTIAETENKYIVAEFISRYSKKIESSDPHASARLLNVALKMIND